MLIDVRSEGLTGSKVEKACEFAKITLNKNSIAGDKSALYPGGVRVGTPAVTTRGMKEPEMEIIADFISRIIKICLKVQESTGKNLNDFLKVIAESEDIKSISKEVEEFSVKFYLPGFEI